MAFGLGPMELLILGVLCLGGVVALVVVLIVMLNRTPTHPRPWELDDGPPPVRIRCPNCQAINEENAKFCNQCGKAM